MPDLRLIVITDHALAAPRDTAQIVRACLGAGAPAVQLRYKGATAAALYEEALALRELTREHGALLFINDRLDVALAAGADGVHLGPEDVPLARARRIAPAPFLIGVSTDEPDCARDAQREGADYIGCGAVFGTTTKHVAGQAIGAAGLARVARAVEVPVIAIGGVGEHNVGKAAAAGAAGVAVIGALMRADRPEHVTRRLLEAFPHASLHQT